MSISGDKVGDPAHHFDPDEMGEIMWEMRPRFATSAGELKRRKKKEMLAERDRKEVRSTQRYRVTHPGVNSEGRILA